MAKIKKTRKEKKLADQRKQVTLTSVKQPIPAKEKVDESVKPITAERNKASITIPSTTISTSGYNYLFQDLAKTAILTSSIVIAELVIKQFAKI